MVSHAAAAEGASGYVSSETRPYTPGWLDALVSAIERLPGPIWAFYVALSALAVGFVALEAALSSRGIFGQDPLYFGYAVFHVYPLAAYHFLSRRAQRAWDAFRPATAYSEAEAGSLRLELSTTPARPAIAAYFAGAVLYLLMLAVLPAGFDLIGHQPAFVALRVASEVLWLAPLCWMLVYLLFRQLRIVSRLHRSVVRVDLLKPAPLHALARLTAGAAIAALLLQLSIVFVPLPNLGEPVRLTISAILLPFIGLALAAFFLPLRGLHTLLEIEKARRQDAASDRIDTTVDTLHAAVDAEIRGAHDAESSRITQLRVDALSKALASLLQEREFTAKLSTWPWDTSTLRAVISAFALPIVLFLATRVLERFVL
jgi:hypothetical protein